MGVRSGSSRLQGGAWRADGLALSRLSESRFPGKSPSRHVTYKIWQKRAWGSGTKLGVPSGPPAAGPTEPSLFSQVTDSVGSWVRSGTQRLLGRRAPTPLGRHFPARARGPGAFVILLTNSRALGPRVPGGLSRSPWVRVSPQTLPGGSRSRRQPARAVAPRARWSLNAQGRPRGHGDIPRPCGL